MRRQLPDRRTVLRGGALASLAVGAGVATQPSAAQKTADHDVLSAAIPRAPEGLNENGTKLVLLGTCGGPMLGQPRHMTSQIMISNGAAYVLDCGMTVSNRIAQAGIAFDKIRGVFITHHHPDHNSEYGPLLLMSWIHGLHGELNTYGPPPLQDITDYYLKSIDWTVKLWIEDLKGPPFPKINAHEIAGSGPVMADDDVRVTAALVRHPPIVPAFGYRFDFHDRSIAFSGDTVMVESVVDLAKGADVLVHEAMYMPALDRMVAIAGGHDRAAILKAHMLRDHTSAVNAGLVAQRAGVKTLVLSHLTPGGVHPAVTDAQWRSAAATHFRGEIIVGHDLMVI